MKRLNDIIYAKEPVKEAIEFKRDIIVEDIERTQDEFKTSILLPRLLN